MRLDVYVNGGQTVLTISHDPDHYLIPELELRSIAEVISGEGEPQGKEARARMVVSGSAEQFGFAIFLRRNEVRVPMIMVDPGPAGDNARPLQKDDGDWKVKEARAAAIASRGPGEPATQSQQPQPEGAQEDREGKDAGEEANQEGQTPPAQPRAPAPDEPGYRAE